MGRYSKYLTAVAILIVAAFFLPTNALASGLVDTTVNDAYGFSRYPIGNYALDLYIDPDAGRGFLGIQLPDVSRILFSITNAIWELCVFLASIVGSVVQEAFRLDFLSQATGEIGRNIQRIAGVSERGFSSTGFLPMLLPLVVLSLGAYMLYVGVFKREVTKALGAVVNFLVLFILSIGFIAFAPRYIQAINGLSVDLADGALRVTNAILNPGANNAGVAVTGIREALHQVQVHAPWQLLQFGSLDIDPGRVQELLSQAPGSEVRIDAVIREVEVYGNVHLSGEVDRFGTVLVLFFINLGISIFVLSLTGLMIFSQLLLIFYLTLLPVALVLSLFPTFSGIAKRSIERVFNTLLLRMGYTLIITVAFSLPLLVYRVTAELSMPFLLVGFLQILVFWGVHRKQDELLGILSLRSGENHRANQSVLRIGRNLGRKALAFGKGIVAGKAISRRRSQQGANVSREGADKKVDTSKSAETKSKTQETPQNVSTRPGQLVKTDTPNKAEPSAYTEFNTPGGSGAHSMGELVDTPFELKDRGELAKENAQDMPNHARYATTRNVGEFRENESAASVEYREPRMDQREPRRENAGMQRSFTGPGRQNVERGSVDTAPEHTPPPKEAPRLKAPYMPAKNPAKFKLNGRPVTREQLEQFSEMPQSCKEQAEKRNKGRRPR
ncbi:MAG: hypothetical protein FWC72_03620 [Oscillospiraceae bacterium]|nr:hypothetical protein [Oscillospiraceae bacterium]